MQCACAPSIWTSAYVPLRNPGLFVQTLDRFGEEAARETRARRDTLGGSALTQE